MGFWFSSSTVKKKPRTRCVCPDVGPKNWFLVKLTFSSLSSKLILNGRLVPKVAFDRYFIDKSRKSNESYIYHVTIWGRISVAPYVWRDNGAYLWSQILIYIFQISVFFYWSVNMLGFSLGWFDECTYRVFQNDCQK